MRQNDAWRDIPPDKLIYKEKHITLTLMFLAVKIIPWNLYNVNMQIDKA